MMYLRSALIPLLFSAAFILSFLTLAKAQVRDDLQKFPNPELVPLDRMEGIKESPVGPSRQKELLDFKKTIEEDKPKSSFYSHMVFTIRDFTLPTTSELDKAQSLKTIGKIDAMTDARKYVDFPVSQFEVKEVREGLYLIPIKKGEEVTVTHPQRKAQTHTFTPQFVLVNQKPGSESGEASKPVVTLIFSNAGFHDNQLAIGQAVTGVPPEPSNPLPISHATPLYEAPYVGFEISSPLVEKPAGLVMDSFGLVAIKPVPGDDGVVNKPGPTPPLVIQAGSQNKLAKLEFKQELIQNGNKLNPVKAVKNLLGEANVGKIKFQQFKNGPLMFVKLNNKKILDLPHSDIGVLPAKKGGPETIAVFSTKPPALAQQERGNQLNMIGVLSNAPLYKKLKDVSAEIIQERGEIVSGAAIPKGYVFVHNPPPELPKRAEVGNNRYNLLNEPDIDIDFDPLVK